jgi:hypothetical protein
VTCLERQHRSLREDRLIQVRAELGYVDFLRGRYDRAELWLTDALKLAPPVPGGRRVAGRRLRHVVAGPLPSPCLSHVAGVIVGSR